jgi:nucleotide-binding universal stress UspA family protein
VVVGSHGRTGIQKFILGSVASKVLTMSKVPVLIVR